MKFCIKCFEDVEIIAKINSYKTLGDCDICRNRDINVYDSNQNSYLKNDFKSLIDIFILEEDLPSSYPRKSVDYLATWLKEKWSIFNTDITTNNIDDILSCILNDDYCNKRVGIPRLVDNEYLSENSIFKTFSWNDFVESITHRSRYYCNVINQGIFELFCQQLTHRLNVGEIFYRARISSTPEGFDKDNIGAPPKGIASAGRANPNGISYLYLGDSKETVIHEIRAGKFDYITIGKFRVTKAIDIVDFTKLAKLSPFNSYNLEDIERFAVNLSHLAEINNQLAKPMKRFDSKLDYLPTQYISSFIESIRNHLGSLYSGIKYKSTMNNKGFNIAIFDASIFECIETEVTDIKKISYDF